MLLLVTVSAAVGKMVIPANTQALLKKVVLSPSGANAMVKIRDIGGGPSGEVVLWGRAPSAYGSKIFDVKHKFTKGMHVTVIGVNAQAFVQIE